MILDLEDAVLPESKSAARASVVQHLARGARCWVRVNAAGSDWHDDDLAALSAVSPLGVVVPKAESPADLALIAKRLGEGTRLMALVESASGLESANLLAAQRDVDRLAFGSIDFALDVEAEPSSLTVTSARSRLVIASHAAGLPGPLDGITVDLNWRQAEVDALLAKSVGMGGKLCIHPSRVRPVQASFRPSAAEVDEASRIVHAAAASQHGALVVDGRLVDRPMLERARRILTEAVGTDLRTPTTLSEGSRRD